MIALARHRTTVIWLALVVATLVSWYLSADHSFDARGGPRAASVAILCVAFVKVRFVGREFMELRGAPPGLRRAFDGWVVVVLGALVAIYLATA